MGLTALNGSGTLYFYEYVYTLWLRLGAASDTDKKNGELWLGKAKGLSYFSFGKAIDFRFWWDSWK